MNTIRQLSLRFWLITALAFPLGWFLGKRMVPKNAPGSLALTPEKPYTILPLGDGRTQALQRLLSRHEQERTLSEELAFLAQLSDRELASAYQKAKLAGAHSLAKSIEEYWAMRDPKGALEFAKWDLDACDNLAFLSLSELARREPEKWVQAALNLGHKGLTKDRNKSFWRADSREEQLKQYRAELEEKSLITRTFEDLAAKDVKNAAKEAIALKDGRAKSEALRGVARAWATRAPSEALAWAKDIKPNASRLEAMRSVLGQWAKSDPAECAKHISDLPKSLASIPVVEQLMETWSTSHPEEALDWIANEATGTTREQALRSFVEAAANPADAARLLVEQGFGADNPEALQKAVLLWGKDDPATALEWAVNQPAEVSESAMHAAFRGWAEESPQEALAYFEKLKGEGLIPNAEKALVELAAGMGDSNPAGALKVLEQMPLDNGEQRKIASDALARLADGDPKQAGQWLEQMAGSLDKNSQGYFTVNGVVSKWVQNDPQAVEEWLSRMPASQTKDWAIQSLAFHLMSTDRQAAFAWASKASDPQDRINIVANMLADLPRHSGVAELVANAPFSEAEKASFQHLIKGSGHGKTSPWEPEPES